MPLHPLTCDCLREQVLRSHTTKTPRMPPCTAVHTPQRPRFHPPSHDAIAAFLAQPGIVPGSSALSHLSSLSNEVIAAAHSIPGLGLEGPGGGSGSRSGLPQEVVTNPLESGACSTNQVCGRAG